MNDRNLDQLLSAWMDLGPAVAPERVADAARLEARSTRQTAIGTWWPPRRIQDMNMIARVALATAAVAVVAILGYGYLVRPDAGDPAIGASASPTASASVLDTNFDEQDGGLAAGTYVTRAIEPLAIRFTIPAGWEKQGLPTVVWANGSNASVGFMIVERVYADPCTGADEYRDVGPSVDDLIDALNTSVGFLDVTAPVEVSVDGYLGKRVRVTDPQLLELCNDVALLWEVNPPVDLDGDGMADPMPLQENMEFTILDVDGTRLVIGTTYRADATTEDRESLTSILESIRIDLP